MYTVEGSERGKIMSKWNGEFYSNQSFYIISLCYTKKCIKF